jgi:hypothetical protein
MKPRTPAPVLPASAWQVLYLDGTAGWTPANLGRFATREDAADASRDWLAGFARTRGGIRPPVRVVSVPAAG